MERKCKNCKHYEKATSHYGLCRQPNIMYTDELCDKFEPKETITFRVKPLTENPVYKKMTEGRYPFGNDEDKVIKYCANDVVIIAEQMARDKQKELENKIEEYEKMLLDIYSVLHPYRAKVKNLTLEKAFRKLPEHVKTKVETYQDNITKYQYALGEKADTIDELKAENAKLKEEIEALKSDIGLKNAELSTMRFTRIKDNKRWREVNDKFWIPLAKVLYGTTKVNKRTEDVLNDISELKERADGNYKASIRKDELIKSLRNENKTREEENEYWKERCHNAETNQFVMIGEKDKEIEELKKKNRELQIRVNDLLFQEKLNKSAFGYDYEEENSKLRVENERLRNQLKYYPTYSALKAEDKIEHIQKEAKKWKNKYKEAYDILETYFKYDLVGMEYDVSYDELNLRLSYSTPNGDKTNKYNALTSAYERLKKL